MDVAIMFSGGKDSVFALQHAQEKGWNIKYLISIKPTRKDCYLFHYATVEHTKKIADMLGIPQVYVSCSVAEPEQEAEIVKNVVTARQKLTPVSAVILGGTGLQETQLRSIQSALLPLHIEVFAAHAGEEHDMVMEQMLSAGYDILISQVASDGLGNWLGKRITAENFGSFRKDAVKFGFHIGGEGGYYDTLVLDAPMFKKRLEISDMKLIRDDACCGHVEIADCRLIEKVVQEKKTVN